MDSTAMQSSPITRSLLESAWTYPQYRKFAETLSEAGETTWPKDDPEYYKKMARITYRLTEQMVSLEGQLELVDEMKAALEAITEPQYWLVVVEPWCGDVAANLPPIMDLAGKTEQVELRIIRRDDSTVIDAHLTDGARSIPKLICLSKDQLAFKWSWGPRPKAIRAMIDGYKANPDRPYKTFLGEVAMWLVQDRGRTIQQELLEAMKAAK